ncbi:anaerobic ribonucleoside-triphosphate reductase activating protein [Cellulosilyticum lentocellum DSM 5427]|uniref:Anaerobic ribonucleoside-triphosphate reductase-activating protein n=2 Tax=Cellulosilyticum lentocellum TaxID=29360 RepID=F2JPS2_CELLD|nr:anaerobic ribonucleoside-triphosphate reductase activating protein [Cellulosilyticum lentocellum DSM 5427]
MYYAQMRKFDVANGVGIRSTLFVSGCRHQCKGCFNEAYQDFHYGHAWDEKAEATFMNYLNDPNVHGVTFLGGEPMEQIEDEDFLNLLKRIKRETNHSIWIYSGYTYEAIITHSKRLALLKWCDVLVDGPYIESLKDLTLRFRGSSNQRIIDVKASLASEKVVLYELSYK